MYEPLSEEQDLYESYYATIRSAGNDSRRQERVWANSFGEAEEKVLATCNMTRDEEIIGIERDYKV